jgi:capsular polysaccharide biosynthesis protein
MSSSELTVSLNVDELAILPQKSSVEELLERAESCRYELLPKREQRASEISQGTIGAVAGSPRPTWWTPDPLITMRSVNLFRILGTYYFPAFGVLIDRQGRALHASMSEASYLTPDLLRLPHLQRRDGDIVFSPPEPVAALPRALVTMPWGGVTNYGHFVIDCLSGVASLNRFDLPRGYDFVFPPLKAWHRDHLQLLGVSPAELAQTCYYVDDAIYTDCMATFLQAPNKNLREIPETQRAALACADGGHRKIYLSRRGNPKRQFLSEERLESILRGRGFAIIQPETMPVREQIALFAGAAVVAGCTGAAFANVTYCDPGAIVLEIQPRTMHQLWVRNICLMMGLKWAPYHCGSREPDQPVVHGGQVRPEVDITFDFDLDEFLAYLDGITEV